MNGDGMPIPGLVDAAGVQTHIGDIVEFTYTAFIGEYPELEIGSPGIEEYEDRCGYGILRLSPYKGAYIVHRGRMYRVSRSRWFVVHPFETMNSEALDWPAVVMPASQRGTWKMESK